MHLFETEYKNSQRILWATGNLKLVALLEHLACDEELGPPHRLVVAEAYLT
jgi:hypothetical protein